MIVHFQLIQLFQKGWGKENMGGLALVQEYMAQDLGVRTGCLSFASKGLHAYDFQIEALKGRIGV